MAAAGGSFKQPRLPQHNRTCRTSWRSARLCTCRGAGAIHLPLPCATPTPASLSAQPKPQLTAATCSCSSGRKRIEPLALALAVSEELPAVRRPSLVIGAGMPARVASPPLAAEPCMYCANEPLWPDMLPGKPDAVPGMGGLACRVMATGDVTRAAAAAAALGVLPAPLPVLARAAANGLAAVRAAALVLTCSLPGLAPTAANGLDANGLATVAVRSVKPRST